MIFVSEFRWLHSWVESYGSCVPEGAEGVLVADALSCKSGMMRTPGLYLDASLLPNSPKAQSSSFSTISSQLCHRGLGQTMDETITTK